jgi:hypothetical protein
LQLHFLSDGLTEPVVIELPKGSYTPVFRPRQAWKSEPEPAPEPAPRRSRRWPLIGAGIATATLLVWAGLVLTGRPGTDGVAARFWRTGFRNGLANSLVLADGNLLQLTDVLNRRIGLYEYRSHEYPKRQVDAISDPAVQEHARRLMSTHMTSLQDASSLRQLMLLGGRQAVSWNMVFARDYRPLRGAENRVLVGHPKANPWVELYEARLNFRYEWIPDRRVARIVNQDPRPGEAPYYEVLWAQRGYALIAFLKPGPENSSVLILGGTDLMSVEAAAKTMADEAALVRLVEGMGIAPGESVPPFEALLETRLLANAPTDSRLLAWRVHRPGAAPKP